MNRYSRVFHHISVEDVKRNVLKKYKENENFLESIKNARKFLKDMNSPYYSDWRSSKLKEGMDTSNVFVTTFPSTGDSNLENIDANNADAYTAAGGLDALNGTSIRSNGSGSGSDGGFNVGQSYLGFDGEVTSRHAILDPIDSSKFDTMSIRAIVGNDSNGGEDPDVPGEELRLYYLEPNGSSFKSIAINPAGDQVLSADSDVIIALGDGLDGALQNFSISLPSYARGEGFTYMIYQLSNSGSDFDHYGITNVKYQRRNPVTLVVSLDSPEAVSFIRDGGNLTPAEKKKRLEDMLAASDEYMDTMFPTNQEAMRRAEENLKRNIDISLDPNTFKFPDDPATWDELFPRSVTDSSSAQQIDRYMESKGLTFDTLTKDAINKNFDRSSQLNIINTSDVENRDKFLTALGINVDSLNNLTDDTYRKIWDSKIYMQPGGTPSTGWDGKMYEYNSPELEKSRIVPLQTYLEAQKRDGYYGVERPDVAPPGRRYVMEKRYGFSSDEDVTPKFTGPQNETYKEQSEKAEYNIRRVGSYGSLGYPWALSLYEKGFGGGADPKTNFAQKQVLNAMTATLNHMYKNRDVLAFSYANEYGFETTAEYDPLYFLLKFDDGKRAFQLASNTTARQLDYPYPSSGGGAPVADGWWHADVAENDRVVADFKKAYDRIKSMSTDFASYDNDEWYVKNKGATGGQSNVTVGAPLKAHPYANVNMTQPETPKSDDPFMDIQVGDERIVKKGDETVLDTMKGIDDRQKTEIEKEIDRIKKMPPDVRGELMRLLDIAGTSEYTPTSPQTKKEIEDYWASLPPEKISEIEGRTQAYGVDALGLGLAMLGGLALGASGAGAAITSAVSGGISKIKNLVPKAKPKPTQAKYPTKSGPSKTVTKKGADFGKRMRQQVAKDYGGSTISQQGGRVIKTKPSYKDTKIGGNTSLLNSYQSKGKLISEKSKDYNEIIAKQGKLKSPSDFFKQTDVKPVYPKDPPPEMVNGYHPDLVDGEKVSNRFNKLDPQSAKAMPPTGNPHIDKKVRAAAKKPK